MDSLQKLIEMFRKFPGIGPRQARRFAYYLLSKDDAHNKNLSSLIASIKKEIKPCQDCKRFVVLENKNLCDICADSHRDHCLLTVVSRDVDLEAIEKSGTYNGLYFVLGGNLMILEKEPEKVLRIKELLALIDKRRHNNLKEIIFGLNANPEGENTEEYIISILKPIIGKTDIKISRLGRGLSTGTELEYADPDTLKNALKHRE